MYLCQKNKFAMMKMVISVDQPVAPFSTRGTVKGFIPAPDGGRMWMREVLFGHIASHPRTTGNGHGASHSHLSKNKREQGKVHV
jgi:hypothetical protein